MAEQILIDIVADSSQLVPTIDLMQKLGQISEADAAQFRKLATDSSKAQKSIVDGSKSVVKSLKDVEKGLSNLADGAEEAFVQGMQDALDEAGISADQFTKALTQNFGKVEKSGKSLKGQLREMKEELTRLDDAGKGGSQEFLKMAVAAAKLEDQLGDTAARVRALASDTANIDAAVQGVQVIAAGFQIAAGAQELFGEGSEDVQKALVKLNAIMALTTGIQQLQNSLQKQTILIQKLGIIQTRIAAFVQGSYTSAVGTSTGALKAFRIALLGTGILGIIALLTWAAEAMGLFGGKTDETTVSIEDQKAAADKLVSSLDDVAEAQRKARAGQAGGSDDIKREIELIKARGKGGQELFDKEQALRRKELVELKAFGEVLRTTAFKTVEEAQALAEREKEIKKDVKDKENEIIAAQITFEKDAGEKRNAITEKDLKALYEIKKRALERERDLQKVLSESEASDLPERIKALEALNTAKLSLIELNRAEEKRQKNLSNGEIKNIDDKFDKERLDAASAFGLARVKIILENNKKIEDAHLKRVDDFKAAEEKSINDSIQNVEKLFASYDTTNEKNKDTRLEALKQQYDAGLITLDEYEQKRQDIIDDFARTEITNEIAKLKAIIALRKAFGQDVAALEKNLYALADQLRQTDLDKQKKADADKVKSAKDAADKRKETEKALKEASIQLAQEISDAVFEIRKSQREAELQAQITALNTQKNNELDNKNLTEQQKSDINEKFRQKERKLKTDAAKKEKEAAISQAIINGLIGIVKTFASYGFTPVGIIAAALQAATTAITIAKIRSTPLPQYAKGTKKAQKGYAIVGEEGPEIVKLSGGERIYTHSQSKRIMNGWDGKTPISAESLPSVDSAIISNTHISKDGSMFQFDYKKLGQEISKNIPQTGIDINGEGLQYWMQQGNSKTTFKNQRYKTN